PMNFSFASVQPFSTLITRVPSTSTTRSSHRHPQNEQTTSSILIRDTPALPHQHRDRGYRVLRRLDLHLGDLEIRHPGAVGLRADDVLGVRPETAKDPPADKSGIGSCLHHDLSGAALHPHAVALLHHHLEHVHGVHADR